MAKIAIIWFCLYAFIAAGFEHPIANMTVFSVALLSDLPTTITLGGTAWSLFFVSMETVVSGTVIMGMGVLYLCWSSVSKDLKR
jgi:nitrite transporter NirC